MKSISGKRLCKILEKKDWVLVCVTGSHNVYRKQGAKLAVSVPVHNNRDHGKG